MSRNIPTNHGTISLRLDDVLLIGDKPHRLLCDFQRYQPHLPWPGEGLGVAPTFNSRDHELQVSDIREDLNTISFCLTSQILSDDWVPGGTLELQVRLEWTGLGKDCFEGTAEGTFAARPVSGQAWGYMRPASSHVPRSAIGQPRVLREWHELGCEAKLPDFSRAGYKQGAEPPRRDDLPVFDVTDYGAEPDKDTDARHGIQLAIDAAARHGGGIVQLPPGQFHFGVEEKQPPLELYHSDIVLLGSGSWRTGTQLINHRCSFSPDPASMWRANEHPGLIHVGHVPARDMGGYGAQPTKELTRVEPADRYATELRVQRPDRLAVGDVVLLAMREDDDGSLAKSLIAPAEKLADNYLGANRILFTQYVEVLAIDGHHIRIDLPVQWQLENRWRPTLLAVPMLRRIGIENLRLVSMWDRHFVHHRNAEHDNGWDHIRIDGLADGWVRNIVHDSPSSTVGLKGCKNCTVMDQRVIGNPGHNGFTICSSNHNLYLRCDAGRQMHAFGLQTTPCGNAFVDCQADEPAGIDMHGGIGVNNLYDNLLGCVNSGGGSGSAVPPRHGRGLVLWNWQMGTFDPYQPWREAGPYAIASEMAGFISVGVRGRKGGVGTVLDLDGESVFVEDFIWQDWGIIEQQGMVVEPASLYRHQIAHRLGHLPEYLAGSRTS